MLFFLSVFEILMGSKHGLHLCARSLITTCRWPLMCNWDDHSLVKLTLLFLQTIITNVQLVTAGFSTTVPMIPTVTIPVQRSGCQDLVTPTLWNSWTSPHLPQTSMNSWTTLLPEDMREGTPSEQLRTIGG